MVKLFKALRVWWLALWCPNFHEEMPKEQDKVGHWEVGAIVHSHFHHTEKENKIIDGTLRDAYIEARSIALKVDWNTPNDELGVAWFVRLKKHFHTN